MYENQTCLSITPNMGKEFSKYKEVAEYLKIKFYFPLHHQPWQRGTNENTNGLIRELNSRPRKCLNWLTPYET